MVRLIRNARIEPTPPTAAGRLDPITRRRPDDPRCRDPAALGACRAAARRPPARRLRRLRQPARASGGPPTTATCSSKLSPEEMADAGGPADSTNLFQRWLTPRGNPGQVRRAADLDHGPRLGRMAADGQARPRSPRPTPSSTPRSSCSSRASSRRPRSSSPRSPRTARARTWGENAQYYLAESPVPAQEVRRRARQLREALRRLPRHGVQGQAHAREYEIAQIWLAQTDPKAPAEKKLPWTARFDGRLPIIDTQGSGLKALEHVRHNYPDGPMADQAAIEIADFYMKHEDYESAAMYYDQFVDEYGGKKSPHLQYAQLAAIDARMKGYLGPEYDASGLEKAATLIGKTMNTFPDRQASFEKLYLTLDHINDAQAEKTFTIGMYYKRTKKVASAEYYLGKIPQRWPNSPWAVKAKTELAELAKMPRKPSKPSKIIIPPGASDPFMSAGPGGMGGMGWAAWAAWAWAAWAAWAWVCPEG